MARCAAENVPYYAQEHGGRGAVFVRCQCSCNVFNIQHVCDTTASWTVPDSCLSISPPARTERSSLISEYVQFPAILEKNSLFANTISCIGVLSYRITWKALVPEDKQLRIQICRQRSLVIGLLAPCKSILRCLTMLLLSFTTQPYQHLSRNVPRSCGGKLTVQIFRDFGRCSHSHMTPCRTCSRSFLG